MSWLEAVFEFFITLATHIATIPFFVAGEIVAIVALAVLLLPFAFASEAIGNFIQRRWGWSARRKADNIASNIALALLLWLPIVATLIGLLFVIARMIISRV